MTEQREKEKRPFCPYCDEGIIEGELPYCQACGVTIFYCPQCRAALPRDSKVCPRCGIEITGETK